MAELYHQIVKFLLLITLQPCQPIHLSVMKKMTAANPDVAVSATMPPSTMHSNLSLERADLPLNVEDGNTTDKHMTENIRIRSERPEKNLLQKV